LYYFLTLCFWRLFICIYLNRKKISSLNLVQEGPKTNPFASQVHTDFSSPEVKGPGCDTDNTVSLGPRPRTWSASVVHHFTFPWNWVLQCIDTLVSTQQTAYRRDTWKLNICESWGLPMRDTLQNKHVRYISEVAHARYLRKGTRVIADNLFGHKIWGNAYGCYIWKMEYMRYLRQSTCVYLKIYEGREIACVWYARNCMCKTSEEQRMSNIRKSEQVLCLSNCICLSSERQTSLPIVTKVIKQAVQLFWGHVPKFPTNFEEIIPRPHENFEEQNKVLEKIKKR